MKGIDDQPNALQVVAEDAWKEIMIIRHDVPTEPRKVRQAPGQCCRKVYQ